MSGSTRFEEKYPLLAELLNVVPCNDDLHYRYGLEPREIYAQQETALSRLDGAAFAVLKEKAARYVARPHRHRRWQQLSAVLHEAKGYEYLQSRGCSGIRFIPEGSDRTPDLEARLGSRTVLLEAKLVSQSDAHLKYLRKQRCLLETKRRPKSREIPGRLNEGLIHKIGSTVNEAGVQLRCFCGEEDCVRIVFVDLALDYHAADEDHVVEQVESCLQRKLLEGVGAAVSLLGRMIELRVFEAEAKVTR